MPLYFKSPITGEQIQVAENDFPHGMGWNNAMSACAGLGNGWRLPTKEELLAMHNQLHKQGRGNFKNEWYYSSSQYISGFAWFVDFTNGFVSNYYGYDDYYAILKFGNDQVRAVRALP